MVSRFLSLLMCFQVLICPALCMAKCAHPVSAVGGLGGSQGTEKTCKCCPHEKSESDQTQDPTRPKQPSDSSDCPDCFCSGSLVIVKDSVAEIDFEHVGIVFVDFAITELAQSSIDAPVCSFNLTRSLYGRDLLRKYCVLLI